MKSPWASMYWVRRVLVYIWNRKQFSLMGEGTGPLKNQIWQPPPPHVACLFSLKFVVEMEREREQMLIFLFTSVKSSWVLKDGGRGQVPPYSSWSAEPEMVVIERWTIWRSEIGFFKSYIRQKNNTILSNFQIVFLLAVVSTNHYVMSAVYSK